MRSILIGLGIIGGTAAVMAYVSRKSTEEIVQVIADLPEEIDKEKFSEMDGELLCNACGAMFDTTETSCPSWYVKGVKMKNITVEKEGKIGMSLLIA